MAPTDISGKKTMPQGGGPFILGASEKFRRKFVDRRGQKFHEMHVYTIFFQTVQQASLYPIRSYRKNLRERIMRVILVFQRVDALHLSGREGERKAGRANYKLPL